MMNVSLLAAAVCSTVMFSDLRCVAHNAITPHFAAAVDVSFFR